MNKKLRQTLASVFHSPVRANILWNDIERLLLALGAEISEGNGSRVRIGLNGVRSVFHRPHPQKEADRGAVRDLQRFFTEAGINRDEI